VSAEKNDSLYKFASATTALQILETQQLRWSAPECFGDVLELSSTPPLGFDTSTLLDATIKLASSMIFAPENPKGDSPLINAINRWREDERFRSPEEANSVLRELLTKMVEYRAELLQSSLAKWQAYARNVRICCFCEKLEPLAVWDQFADSHRGVALRFNNASADWTNLRPVIYQGERPQITTQREQLSAILHYRQDNMSTRFIEHYLIKSSHRKQECEWRASRMSTNEVPISDTNSATWFNDVGFTKETLTELYFGAAIDPIKKQQIMSLMKTKYPQVKLYQGQVSKTNYALEFERLAPAPAPSKP
jgi:Protein of unknown function (DUF2971)